MADESNPKPRTKAAKSRAKTAAPAAAPAVRKPAAPRKRPMAVSVGVTPEARHAMIAVSAYYRAEARGFIGGCPVQDWLEAEREVDGRLLEAAPAAPVKPRRTSAKAPDGSSGV